MQNTQTLNRNLRDNMRRLYIESTVALWSGRTSNPSLHGRRRDHARATLMERCGYTQATMTILHAEAMRQAGR